MSDLIKALRRYAVVFCKKPVYESNGDSTLLVAHAVNCAKAANEIEAQQAEIARLRELVEWAAGRLEELNPSNYDHDDVCSVNAASFEVIVALQGALEQKP